MNLLSKSLDNEKPLILYGDDDIIVNINFLTDVSKILNLANIDIFGSDRSPRNANVRLSVRHKVL